jgi:hypothetical protein
MEKTIDDFKLGYESYDYDEFRAKLCNAVTIRCVFFAFTATLIIMAHFQAVIFFFLFALHSLQPPINQRIS